MKYIYLKDEAFQIKLSVEIADDIAKVNVKCFGSCSTQLMAGMTGKRFNEMQTKKQDAEIQKYFDTMIPFDKNHEFTIRVDVKDDICEGTILSSKVLK